MKIENNKFAIGEQTAERPICNETILLFWNKETSFFLLTWKSPDEVFIAGFLELSITWFSEIVKWNYASQLTYKNRRKTSY